MKCMIKTRWASARIISDGAAVTSYTSAKGPSCVYFRNINELAEAINKKKIRVKHWIISVPDNLCISKTIDLPAADISQAYRMLEFELPSYLPLTVDELVYGCVSAGLKDNLFRVQAYIIKLESLREILEQYQLAKINPSKVAVDSIAIRSWFGLNSDDKTNQMNILVTENKLHIFVIIEGCLRGYEKIDWQNHNPASQKENIIKEISSLDAEYFTEQPVLKIATNKDVGPEIYSWLSEHYSNIEYLERPHLKSFTNGLLPVQDGVYESVVSAGLVNIAEDSNVGFLNLLPKMILRKTRKKKRVINSAVVFGLVVLAIIGLWLNFAVMNWKIQRACRKISEEIAPIRNIADDVESKRQKVKAIQAQLANRDQIRRLFLDLYQFSPKQISLSQMSYSSITNAASVSLKGQADTLSRAFEYSDVMKDSNCLNNIQIINAQQIPKPGGSIVEFKAECTISKN